MIDGLITVFETKCFTRISKKIINDKERLELLLHLKDNPKSGDIIAKTGGIRKIRWATNGKGKRGGIRVIYYFYDEGGALFMLTLYSKGDKTDLKEREKKELKELVSELVSALRGKLK